jgi:hypothetical protein
MILISHQIGKIGPNEFVILNDAELKMNGTDLGQVDLGQAKTSAACPKQNEV